MKSSVNIDHICNLAHLKLSSEEKKYLVPQMIKIIEWVNKLEELKIDISRGEVYSPLASSLPWRKDEVQPSLPLEKALANSPEKSQGYIKVPKVIEGK
ncbi:MAG: Asp-tRNA(Asn)/Glu-tRNA(Gln) amidotransferase subunit GatC [Candidatus Aminicenantales bacterium]